MHPKGEGRYGRQCTPRALMRRRRALALLLSTALLAGCASKPWDRTELMPAPAVFEDGRFDPFAAAVNEKLNRSRNRDVTIDARAGRRGQPR